MIPVRYGKACFLVERTASAQHKGAQSEIEQNQAAMEGSGLYGTCGTTGWQGFSPAAVPVAPTPSPPSAPGYARPAGFR